MKIFKICCFLVLWLTLFVAFSVAYYLHGGMDWGLAMATLFGIVIMLAASLFIDEAFD